MKKRELHVCKHGELICCCEICEAAERIATLERERDALKEKLVRYERIQSEAGTTLGNQLDLVEELAAARKRIGELERERNKQSEILRRHLREKKGVRNERYAKVGQT